MQVEEREQTPPVRSHQWLSDWVADPTTMTRGLDIDSATLVRAVAAMIDRDGVLTREDFRAWEGDTST
jgi:hypothetical protein